MITLSPRLERYGTPLGFIRDEPGGYIEDQGSLAKARQPFAMMRKAVGLQETALRLGKPSNFDGPSAFVIPSSFGFTHSSFARLVVTLASLITSFCYSQNQPSRKELWVPSEHLNQVLKEHPNAVLLSSEQYDTLIRDAGKVKPPEDLKNKPPIALAVEGLQLSGKLDPLAETIRLTGTLNLFSTSADWAQLDIPWHLPLLSAKASGQTLVSLSRDGGVLLTESPIFSVPRTLHLHVKGEGRHTLIFESELHLKHNHSTGWHELYLCGSGITGYLDLDLPSDLQLLNSSPFQTLATQKVRLPLVKNTVLNVAEKYAKNSKSWPIPVSAVARWTSAGLGIPTDQPSFADSSSLTTQLSETEVLTQQQVFLHSAGQLAQERSLSLKLSAGAEVTSVLGAEVLRWHQDSDQLHLTLAPNAAASQLTLHLRSGLQADVKAILIPQVFLPSPTKASVQITHSEGLELLAASGQELTLNPQLQAKVLSAPLGALPVLQARLAKARLEVDADTLLALDKDSLSVTRTLNLRTDRPIHELRLTLPEGEEFIRIQSAAKGFEWKRLDRTLELRFPEGVTPKAAVLVDVYSRKKLLKAWSGARIPELLSFTTLSIPEATKIAGYSALAFNDAWRVALKESTGLEDRDAKLAPVKGRMAWFGLRDWKLSFEVERAEPVFSAEITAYALPRARTVEIEGQITLDITGAPLRRFQLKLPVTEAKLFRLTSALIGEQQLEETTGLWTYMLRQESIGRQPMRFRLSLPAQVTTAAEQTLKASLPRLELPAARRFTGTWVIEANTDTQVSFETQSLQPLDVLRAPPIQDYQPRHRLIAAYTYSSGQQSLKLTARRHAHSELAAIVVRELKMISTLGEDGSALHEALFSIQHSGEQFVALILPEGAELLATASDGIPVKPIRSAEGTLAIPLPPGSANQPETKLRVQYRLTEERWTSRGHLKLEPVRLLGTTPVLDTDWRLLVPPGYEYPKITTKLHQTKEEVPRIIPRLLLTAGLATGLVQIHSQSVGREIEFLPSGLAPSTEADREMARLQLVDKVTTQMQQAQQFKKRTVDMKNFDKFILPRVQLSGATIEEAVEFLRLKIHDRDISDGDGFKGPNLVLDVGDSSSAASISLDLKDVLFMEALRYITELAGMKYQIEHDAIRIVPVTETATEQFVRIFRVPPDFLRMGGASGSSSGISAANPFELLDAPESASIRTMTASEILKAQGVLFPEGASAVFNSKTSQLIVKNTGPNLDLIESFVSPISGQSQATKSNLISLDLDLPTAGQVLHFSGHHGPESLMLRYVSWERQLGFAMLAMLAGMGVFIRWGQWRPWRKTLLLFALFTFGAPLLMSGPSLALANASLFGWLLALGGWIIFRAVEKISQFMNIPTHEEVSA